MDPGRTLDKLLRVIESQSPEMLSSLLLLDADGLHLRHVAAPSCQAYLQAIDDCHGPSVGSCGTAAFRRQPVIGKRSRPIRLTEGREAALAHGLHRLVDADLRCAGNVLVPSPCTVGPAARVPDTSG
jgi:hypothetical protein